MTLGAFQGFGIELEYMIVRRRDLEVAPIADRVLGEGRLTCGALGWSNELVAHVVELKNVHPSANLDELQHAFHREVHAMNERLAPLGVCLMPTGMHPWMDPRRETQLWPNSNAAVYQTYDRIFDCRNHGWANLQSTHINLPFDGDEQFARLHRAVRLALPLLPAVTASSPFMEGTAPGALDCRLRAYRHNADAVPEMTGEMVPEPMRSRAQYEQELLAPLYRALEPHDPQRLLRYEWANARGAIARFDRSALEIRVVDVQECPAADVALAAAIIDLVWLIYEEDRGEEPTTGALTRVLDACVADGERATIDCPEYLRALGLDAAPRRARDVWFELIERMADAPHRALWQPALELVLERGSLARRMLAVVGRRPGRADLARLYGSLCECLERNRVFDPSAFS